MSDERSLLAHLVPRLTRGVENAATDALAFILNKSSSAMNVLADMVSTSECQLPPLRYAKTQVTLPDKSRLDLVGYDGDGSMRLVIESKFWAPLLAGQASGYIRHLPSDGPAMLLFVAPLIRHETLRIKIERQFAEASGLSLNPSLDVRKMWVADVIDTQSRAARKRVALMSWEALLAGLENADPSVEGDIQQLRGLAAEQDQVAFTPLHPEDLGASIPRRIMSFCDLIDGVVSRGKSEH